MTREYPVPFIHKDAGTWLLTYVDWYGYTHHKRYLTWQGVIDDLVKAKCL